MPRPPTNVLLIAGPRPDRVALGHLIGTRKAEAATITLVTYKELPADYPQPDHLHLLAAAAEGHGPAFRRRVRGQNSKQKLATYVANDSWLIVQARSSTIVAVDKRALPAVRALTAARDASVRQRALAVAAAMPVWAVSLLRRAPTLSEGTRRRIAGAAALRTLERGKPAAADRIASATASRIESARVRADLLGDVVSAELAAGMPAALARRSFAAELDNADAHYRAGEYADAAESMTEAMRTAFHRVLHFDGPSSPLASDPAGYTAPLKDSVAAQALRAPRGRTRSIAPQTGAPQPVTRLLIATRGNVDFLAEIREHFGALPTYKTDFVDFQSDERLTPFIGQIIEQTLSGGQTVPAIAEAVFRPYLDKTDVMFIDWCTALAALITQVDTGGTRVVVRMHSYEAFTRWPHLVDFTRIDDLVFVSDHLRDLAIAAIPALQSSDAPRMHVITNAMDLRRCVAPKSADARFTLALIGASKLVKDPRWAIEVLRILRRHDERYRLLLIGGKFQDPTAATRDYATALRHDLAELEPVGAVRRIRYTDDVPAALQDVGVVLSTSIRESFHIGLVEGAASGAVPVVRDWPFFPGAAANLFPPDWIVYTPAEAASRILDLAGSDDAWRTAGREASAWVIDQWDWHQVRGDYERLLRR